MQEINLKFTYKITDKTSKCENYEEKKNVLKMSCSQWFLTFCEFKLKQDSKNNGRIKTNQGKGSRKNH